MAKGYICLASQVLIWDISSPKWSFDLRRYVLSAALNFNMGLYKLKANRLRPFCIQLCIII